MATKLPREAFLALCAVGWADGKMGKDEASALLRAAKESGHDGDDYAAIEKATKEKTSLDAIDTSKLSPWQAAMTFAIASYVARIDGAVKPDEHDSLRALGKRLALNDKTQQSAAAAAYDVAMLPSGRRPEKYDFGALEVRVGEKLSSLKQ